MFVEKGEKGVGGVVVELEVLGLVVSVVASLALRASVKQAATRCIESPRAETTRLKYVVFFGNCFSTS